MKMRTVLVMNVLFLSLVANAEAKQTKKQAVQEKATAEQIAAEQAAEKKLAPINEAAAKAHKAKEHDDVVFLDRLIEGHIKNAEQHLATLDKEFKAYMSVKPESISIWAKKAADSINEARKVVKALQKGKLSNAKDKAELKKHVAQLNKLDGQVHSYARCSHLAEAAAHQKNVAELAMHIQAFSASDAKYNKINRCDVSNKLLAVLKSNSDVLKKDSALKGKIEAKAIESQKAAIQSAN
jgi:hypothetical protein